MSADADADIRLLDWTGEPLVLHIEQDDDVTSATLQLASADHGEPMPELQPRRFGETVLCLGPEDLARWPADLDLLAQIFGPRTAAPAPAAGGVAAPSAPVALQRRRRRVMVGLATAVLAVGAAFTVLVVRLAREGETRVAPPSPAALAYRVIESTQVSGLVVRAVNGGAIVEGLVADAVALAKVNAALDTLPRGLVQRRFAAASDVARSIAEALDEPSLSVSYVADGEFLVQGSAVRADRLRPASDRIVADLSPLVRTIRLSVIDMPPPPKTPVGAMLETDGLTYVQTRDGTKHLAFNPVPVVELHDSDLGLSSPSADGRTGTASTRSHR